MLDRLATRRAPAEAESREERRRCVGLDAPQSGRLSAGGFGCEPNDVLRRFGFVRACGERLAEELERSALAFSPAVPGGRIPLQAHSDAHVRGGQPTEQLLTLTERT